MTYTTQFQDLTNRRFGRLTVIERVADYVSPKGYHRTRWKCHCDCGTVKSVNASCLFKGDTQSCGCLHLERQRTATVKHGHSRRSGNTKEYCCWLNIIQRCTNPKNNRFHDWGGRGISMCERWLNDFNLFLADVGIAPSAKHTIERINNNGNYEPGNCKWIPLVEQSRNRRNIRFIEWCCTPGWTVAELARHHGIDDGALRYALTKWSPNEAVMRLTGQY